LYRGARALVFASLYEGFGLPVLEAMACGTPVVTSNTTSLPEVAGDAALLVDPTSVDQLAAAIKRIVDDAPLSQSLREKGLRRAAQFPWSTAATAVQNLLTGLAEEGTGEHLR
jgi:glycosyltransferase involved in cell wall biosynthesis